MTSHYPDLGGVSDWSCHVINLIKPIRSTTQIWVVKRHQYGISALVSQTSFREETSGSVAKCRLFSQARVLFQDKKINCQNRERRSCLLSTLDLKKRDLTSCNIQRKKNRSPKTTAQLITTRSENFFKLYFGKSDQPSSGLQMLRKFLVGMSEYKLYN